MAEDNVALALAKLRQAQGLSQEALAAQLRTSQKVVSNWETGTRKPQLANAAKWAGFFGYEVVQDDLGCRHLVGPRVPRG